MRKGNLFVISGPSGAGKGTLVSLLKENVPDCWLSVSATTRAPREGESDGVSYYFLSKETFLDMIEEGGFLEWARYADNYYGTPLASIEDKLAEGKQVILEIEVQGALQVREKMPDAHLVFIEPPSLEVLEERLRNRNTETDDVIEKRMKTAREELSQKMQYNYRLVNDDLDEAAASLIAYVNEQADRYKD